jgi:glycosyltransferase involved in cell wall biosynthesis
MRVLIYHPVLLPVLQYGGTERVVMWLAQTLQKQGHTVSVFAAPGSKMPDGIACITNPEALLTARGSFDVIHGFTKIPADVEAAFDGRVLITIQGNGQAGEVFHRNTVFVSRDHAERHGAREFVYNGLDPDELKFDSSPRPNRYLFLSKTSWRVKNLRGAYRVARQNHQPLWIAGGTGPIDLKLGAKLRRSLGQDWKWVGSVNQSQKADFLIQGRAMLFPLLWNEPFGIVMTEALVSGTPVLAHPFGSVPEVLEFAPQCLMRSKQDWERAVRGELTLPSANACRDWVLSKFDQVQMTKKYLQLYEQIAAGKSLHEKEPITQVTAEQINTDWVGA